MTMDIEGIANLPGAMASARLGAEAGVLVLKKALDAEKAMGEAVVKLIESAPDAGSVDIYV